MVKYILYIATLLVTSVPASTHMLATSTTTPPHDSHSRVEPLYTTMSSFTCSSPCQGLISEPNHKLVGKKSPQKRFPNPSNVSLTPPTLLLAYGEHLSSWRSLVSSVSWRPPDLVLLSGELSTSL